ncbi:helicase-exonuclease AddAB subunit AddA [Paenibacillus sp. GXUN7292]|uniref:helicase-exonuclease AddAB subunit AddA n=1 Tax=Paenibacillus sp. GXUN7292 TaxID=3422499 RepID=UPI003D7C53BD
MVNEASPKPEGSQWTDDQWTAIDTSGANILVAAAAGSGKTAVLVERIIRKISHNTDVDRLLVATFTKAAAAEMKERISIALEKQLAVNPHSEHLRKQLALMNRASITTLHSFCLDAIRRYYPLLELDPGFRIANETESELLRLEVLDELFEQRYNAAAEHGSFLQLVDYFGGERGDEPLYRLVQQLFQFSQSHPWPEYWLEQMAEAYRISDPAELEQSVWAQSLRQSIILAADGAILLLREAKLAAEQPGGPLAYVQTISEELQLIEAARAALESGGWNEWTAAFRAVQFGRLKAVRGDGLDKLLQGRCKELREAAKKQIGTLSHELFSRTLEQFAEEVEQLAPLMEALSQLVITFSQGYEAAKRQKGLLDFGDLEHYCLRILRSPQSTPSHLLPSEAALEYQRQFEEILLDEYQDTNAVQEAIVQLLSRDSPGNRFMVGDVKQSIYRFRLAEPQLFLQKYKSYTPAKQYAVHDEMNEDDGLSGIRIDLARNFRSRTEVVDGVNHVFRSIMREKVAEMDYDKAAELVYQASFPDPHFDCSIQFAVLDKAAAQEEQESEDSSLHSDEASGEENRQEAEEAQELQTAQLEGRWIAAQLLELKANGYQVYDGKQKRYRPFEWRDTVILLRATSQWAPILIEQLQELGIPAYAELGSGYFDATEVQTMLSLLHIIDNPYQDIPLAAVLRSPMFGLTAEQLARIRIQLKHGAYYDAVIEAASRLKQEDELWLKLSRFLDLLDKWRDEARQGSLPDLLWLIYRETGFYDFVGGLPGGMQRQANLRALHDRSRQFESTSMRGLFRFLRFIERMKESGGDLGTARALGEGEDVVRIMSIHKSKGLEFPVVFSAGLGKKFNQQDLRSAFLLHKQLGFGPRIVDQGLKASYPSLPYLAIRSAQKMELLAEEMRILYVALTRPKEKLYLLGTVNDAAKKKSQWLAAAGDAGELPDYRIASAQSFLDWLGPLAMYYGSEQLDSEESLKRSGQEEQSWGWKTAVMPASILAAEAAAAIAKEPDSIDEQHQIQAVASMALLDNYSLDNEMSDKLQWQYPYAEASGMAAKTSVTEMKRINEERMEDAADWSELAAGLKLQGKIQPPGDAGHSSASGTLKLQRPAFMEEKKLTAAERGTANHAYMQHIPLPKPADAVTAEQLALTLRQMLDLQLITAAQAEAIDLQAAKAFLESELGFRLRAAEWVRREMPFSAMLPAGRVYTECSDALAHEPVLIQGVIDCLFEDEQGIVLLDYKTDHIINDTKDSGTAWDDAAERHRFQLELYAEAIEAVLGKPVAECFVFFFDGARSVKIK